MNKIINSFKNYSIWLYIFLSYPVVDFFLRNILGIPVISSLWDDGLLVVLLMFTAGALIEGREQTMSSIKAPLTAFTVYAVALLVMDMPYFSVSFEGFRAIFQYILFFFVGFFLFKKRDEILPYLRVLTIVGILVGAYGLLQVILGVETPQSWISSGESIRTRAFSIIGSPNILGSHMAFLAPLSIGLFFFEKDKKWRLFWLLGALVMIGALMFTFSRGAWIAFAGALSLLGVLVERRLLIIGVIAAILVAVFVPTVTERITYLFTDEYIQKSSSDGRIARWLGAYDQIRYEPLFGKGLGHYGGAVGQRNFGTIYVDSYLFKTLAETGLIGVILFFWLIFKILKESYYAWRKTNDPPYFWLLAGAFTGMVAVLIHNMVENIFEVPYMSSYFWFMTGIILSFPFLKKGEPDYE
ncbi:O-antigen ligase family protein [Microaerobacter geothermalis]|uniref:O-antigen ligase family protein n=1 Tax=Microaerobacter geothermalis TaxID=674972 RepID=UPI001F1D80C6|nr:O-antigen ligase family protein [Microaerobacter geothermalis]MCF6092584.1 O-antigen ligase family protein [Microaerobacter geothermalis]